MSEFRAVKCDECGRIQGEANHWEKVQVWVDHNNVDQVYGVTLGNIVGNAMGTGDFTMAKPVLRDLCGQACAIKHLAKLLKWGSVLQAQEE